MTSFVPRPSLDSALPPAETTLASLAPLNHEASGVPTGAGVPGSATAFDPGRMQALLAALGDPHKALRGVHVVGSKGKGSTASFLTSILSHAGLVAGTYTSPHVVDMTERIGVGGLAIERGALDALAAAAAPALGRALAASPPPTWFEAVTALSLRHFADADAAIAIMEAGLGGGTDATNVWAGEGTLPPLAVLVAAVGLEHAGALGGSLAAVAAAKAAILSRPGVPLILGAQPHAEVDAIFRARARAVGCPVVGVGDVVAVEHARVQAGGGGGGEEPGTPPTTALRLRLDGAAIEAALGAAAVVPLPASLVVETCLRAVGEHQAANAAGAAVAALVLVAAGAAPPATLACLPAALAATPPLPGRFQLARLAQPVAGPESPHLTVVLDGAHTPPAAAALAAALRASFPLPTPLGLVLASAADKDLAGLAGALVGTAPLVAVFTTVPIGGSNARAAAPGAWVGAWQGARSRARARAPAAAAAPPLLPRCREMVKASLPAAIDAAARELAVAGPPGWTGARVLCVAGSLHGVGEAVRGGVVEV